MMNIKLAENEIRVRINRSDVALLLSGKLIFLKMAIYPERPLSFEVKTVDSQDEKLKLVSTQSNITLLVLRQALLDLESILPSRAGIEESWVDYQGQSLALVIEVDIKNR